MLDGEPSFRVTPMSTLFSATGKVTQAVGVRFSIVTSAVANTMSIDAQIEALGEASKVALVFGDCSGNEGQGSSLTRTFLAHSPCAWI